MASVNTGKSKSVWAAVKHWACALQWKVFFWCTVDSSLSQCIEVYCSAMYCSAMYCNVLQHCSAVFNNKLNCIKLYCSALLHNAVYWNVLQLFALYSSVLQLQCIVNYSVLQLQCIVKYSVLYCCTVLHSLCEACKTASSAKSISTSLFVFCFHCSNWAKSPLRDFQRITQHSKRFKLPGWKKLQTLSNK